ncbi:bifunctional diguanylate cyclase/phosphodiesterase [Synechocystis sp. PCC 7509]|uniref:bifunctional diguanylate cyclase/phosphodiesterase n=1 Tax=Synechocystis sp. PCC 7509 TaxID=927677 RepID=UPI0002ABC239|nr:EAL domain-containing protein [Synechocystis sp. PCC 7509]
MSLVTLIGVFYAASSTILSRSLAKVGKQDTEQLVAGVAGVFNQNVADFSNSHADWSAWDDTYKFIQDGNQQYISSNLTNEQIALLDVNLVVYVNSQGKVIFGTGFDLNSKQKTSIPGSISASIQPNNILLQRSNPNNSLAGIIAAKEGLMLISSHPILNSKGGGAVRGRLIFGRYIDAKLINNLSKTTRLSLIISPLNNSILSTDIQTARANLSANKPIFINSLTEETIAGYTLLNDIYNRPVAILRVNHSRDNYNIQSQKSLSYLLISLCVIGLVFGSIALPMLEHLLLFYHERQEREQRYRAVVTQASEGIILVDTDNKSFIEANNALLNLLGYSWQELQKMTLYDIIIGDRKQVDDAIANIAGTNAPLVGEWQFCHKYDLLIDVEFSANAIDYEERDALCIVLRDIRTRKQAEVALRESEKQLSWQATHDPLTELLNRRAFEQSLEAALLSTKNSQQQHILCYLDLDRFKIVNDTCGHLAGDELLKQISNLFQNNLRKTDTLARLGGDEFGILLYDCPLHGAIKIANILREQVSQFTFSWRDRTFSIGVSIGIVAINAKFPSLDIALNAADTACYSAKNKGRNQVHIYQNNQGELAPKSNEMQWGLIIPQAIANNNFRLCYQKIVPIDNSDIKQEHCEVLLRLEDKSGNIILPVDFLPAAERYNLMQQIDRWVIATLFAHLKQQYQTVWESCLIKNLPSLYAVNLSGASINDAQFFDFVQQQFASTQIPPEIICFEITETIAITNLAKAAELINKLKLLGCSFALDDFGSGMSSFAYLKTLPVDYVKIDGTFIQEILQNAIALEMVEAIKRIAVVMGIQTIAEYVENDEIFQKLQSLGVDYAQGYAIAKPCFLDISSQKSRFYS